ncbi:MAG: hypothetical protein GX249_10425 [Firmicutes bacterium]|mgnify:CR=1 FL=1|nr:hypothetical protein [Bacillota bacterium]
MRKLVFDFFQLLHLEPLEIRKGVWQVQADDALMKELDGWRAQGRLLQFTFDQKAAEIYGADLICPGSYRLNTILEVIRRQGRLSQAHIPHHYFHEPSIRKKILSSFGTTERAYVVNSSMHYAQYLQYDILVIKRGLQKNESIHTVVVDLSSGRVLKFAFPHHLLQSGGVANHSVRKHRLGLKQAFLKAADHVQEMVATEDQTWAQKASEKLALEEAKLGEFFQGKMDSPEAQGKKQEMKKRLAPLLSLDALRAALLFVPLFQYRLVVVATSGKEQNRTVTYDPVGNWYLQDLDQITSYPPDRTGAHDQDQISSSEPTL